MNTNDIKTVFFMAAVTLFITLTVHHNSKLHRLQSKRIASLDSFYLDSIPKFQQEFPLYL